VGSKDRSLLVAGVGASAGGFEAFMQLLENLSPNTGMAFVFVPHLDPAHESQLSSLLGRITHMHVAEVKDRTRLQPDHIYIIPPNKMLTVSGGVLQLSPRDKAGQFLPIDFFFESLAQDQGNRAIGIVLSGNAQDGTAGIKAIRAGGGITFAQDPTTAKFPGMPQSATSAGVDFVLPPAGIGKELERISHHSTLRRKKAAKAEQELPGSETELVKVLTALRTATGVDFSYYKQTTLQRRILRRMLLKRIDNLKDYVRLLHEHPAEVGLLFDDILINVTGFFRDPGAFQTLRKKIFPKVVKSKTASTPIRIWVPGCATGEEAYSLAICLHEFLGKRNECSIQIFGTDISETMVSRARLGVFSADISQQVGTERLRRYFQRVNGGYQIAKFIRDMCIFARQNVAEDAPFSKLDLISCRNLLIYLGLPLQKKVLPIFHYSLRPGGFLMLGASETIGGFSNLFTLLDKRSKIYIRNETYTRPHMEYQSQCSDSRSDQAGGGRDRDADHERRRNPGPGRLLVLVARPPVSYGGQQD
jgi:two-component system CheB/CheR fusion protein